MIEMTVGLPLFNSQHIAWLALESLCRQKNIDFEWELIVAEEQNKKMFGQKKVFSYESQLKKVGCKNLLYIPLKKWIPLFNKWRLISQRADLNSKAFILQAGDDYSHPYRLYETYNLMIVKGNTVISSQVGPFYDIPTGIVCLYDVREKPTTAGLNMAVQTDVMKRLPQMDYRKNVDSKIAYHAIILEGVAFKREFNNSSNWKCGVCTNGFHNISLKRGTIMRTRKDIYDLHSGIKIEDCIPIDIIQKLITCKKYARV